MDARTILLADDEAHITCVMSAKLRASGFDVIVARDGEEALALAVEHRPRLIITDLQMPRMSGLEMAQRLMADPGTREIPVVMLSARGYIADPAEMAKTNIRTVISKPFGARDVVRQVLEILGLNDAAAVVPPKKPGPSDGREAA
jgi:two-component system alkaline phosphatase synthesis response regulator PhoP